jgi:5-methylthioadenosine/S-adenosylhomocysteine deaminase
MAAAGTHVLHCPSSNLKLASGIAPVVEMRRRGVSVSLGADGAPCNNRLDMFAEMRLAAMVAKLKHGPAALRAREVFSMATLGGARALGLEDRLGTLEPGKLADVVVIDPQSPSCVPWEDPFTALVYAAQGANVRDVMVDGRWVVRDRKLRTLDEAAVTAGAIQAWRALRERL